jgi:hypothetical protein
MTSRALAIQAVHGRLSRQGNLARSVTCGHASIVQRRQVQWSMRVTCGLC